MLKSCFCYSYIGDGKLFKFTKLDELFILKSNFYLSAEIQQDWKTAVFIYNIFDNLNMKKKRMEKNYSSIVI